jgi:hypothetical protein
VYSQTRVPFEEWTVADLMWVFPESVLEKTLEAVLKKTLAAVSKTILEMVLA